MDECFGRKERQALAENLKSLSSVASSPLWNTIPAYSTSCHDTFIASCSILYSKALTIQIICRPVINNTRS
jgi:hypothetical protein